MRRVTALLALALSSVVACHGSDTTAPAASLAGTWNLTTVNGAPLPFTAQAANPKIEVLNDQIVGTAAGTFTENGSLRITDATGAVSSQPIVDSGTWTGSGTAVSFRFDSDGSTGTGTITGNTFTVAGNGYSNVYIKQ